jgi:hypothetical protein
MNNNYRRAGQIVSVRNEAGGYRVIGVTNGDGTINYY